MESEHVIAPRGPHEKYDDHEHDRRDRYREPSPVQEQAARRQNADPYDTDALRKSRIDEERKQCNELNAKEPRREPYASLADPAERVVQRAKECEAQRHPEEHDVTGQIINQRRHRRYDDQDKKDPAEAVFFLIFSIYGILDKLIE